MSSSIAGLPVRYRTLHFVGKGLQTYSVRDNETGHQIGEVHRYGVGVGRYGYFPTLKGPHTANALSDIVDFLKYLEPS